MPTTTMFPMAYAARDSNRFLTNEASVPTPADGPSPPPGGRVRAQPRVLASLSAQGLPRHEPAPRPRPLPPPPRLRGSHRGLRPPLLHRQQEGPPDRRSAPARRGDPAPRLPRLADRALGAVPGRHGLAGAVGRRLCHRAALRLPRVARRRALDRPLAGRAGARLPAPRRRAARPAAAQARALR